MEEGESGEMPAERMVVGDDEIWTLQVLLILGCVGSDALVLDSLVVGCACRVGDGS